MKTHIKQSGFTVIEFAMASILVAGCVGVSMFFLPIYQSQSRNADDLRLQNQGDILQLLLADKSRHLVPGSLRSQSDDHSFTVEFMPQLAKVKPRTVDGGGSWNLCGASSQNDVLNAGSAPCFKTIGTLPTALVNDTPLAGSSTLVLSAGPGDAYAGNGLTWTRKVTSWANGPSEARIDIQPGMDWSAPPPLDWVYLGSDPVSIRCDAQTQTATLHAHYGIQSVQPVSWTQPPVFTLTHVQGCSLQVTPKGTFIHIDQLKGTKNTVISFDFSFKEGL